MLGPEIPWYLVVSAILFAIGIAGVLLRRSPLIVLLSLEIMLNASNLAFVGFSRLFGEMDGQVFALAVMAVAAVRGVRRARADRRDGAAQPRPRRRQLHGAARMIDRRRLGLPRSPRSSASSRSVLAGDAHHPAAGGARLDRSRCSSAFAGALVRVRRRARP